MHNEDTIAAISTPVGQGGIGIVRLSGGDAFKIADRLFISPKDKKIGQTPSHRILYGNIRDPENNEAVDEVLVSIMKAPNTYTKEDIVEINCHGGIVPLRRVLELVLKHGARLAGPGEFTQRAFMNGRIDLAQAEAVLDVINSLTRQGQKTALRQLRGDLSKKIGAIREELLELTAFVEAHIDFPEEDIEQLSLDKIENAALGIKRSLETLIESSRYGIILREGLNTAIAGRPNVGKSSLLNALLEHDRAIVTEVPGTTRDVIEEYLNIQGLPVKIMDTAGIRTVEDIAEKEGVKRSLRAMEDADLVLLVLDGSSSLHDTDRELIESSDADNTVLVVNKCDLPQKIDPEETGRKTISISAKKGTGLDRLKQQIVDTALQGHAGCGTESITNARHVHALERALVSVNSFISESLKNASPEFLSVELRDALDAIGEILGLTSTEDILDRIFSNFCIGK
jgi:tRNA modification GTPase